MTQFGIPGVLADPILELRDNNGALIRANDNWQDDAAQAAVIVASDLAPDNNLESALVENLTPGIYTGLLAGKNNTTGIGYIQFYTLPHSGPVLPVTP